MSFQISLFLDQAITILRDETEFSPANIRKLTRQRLPIHSMQCYSLLWTDLSRSNFNSLACPECYRFSHTYSTLAYHFIRNEFLYNVRFLNSSMVIIAFSWNVYRVSMCQSVTLCFIYWLRCVLPFILFAWCFKFLVIKNIFSSSWFNH